MVKLTLAVLAPLILLFLIAAGVFFYIFTRRTKRKRKPKARHNKLLIEADLEPSMLHFTSSSHASSNTYHSHELKATAAGDSTLKVSQIFRRIKKLIQQDSNFSFIKY